MRDATREIVDQEREEVKAFVLRAGAQPPEKTRQDDSRRLEILERYPILREEFQKQFQAAVTARDRFRNPLLSLLAALDSVNEGTPDPSNMKSADLLLYHVLNMLERANPPAGMNI